jgi:predicted MFS family arabinose efflux permease
MFELGRQPLLYALDMMAVTFADGADRNRALGIFGAVGGTSASVGVITSGLLTDGPGWRWVFFINVPVGILLLALAARLLAKQEPRGRSRRFEAAGATTVTAGLLVLVYALNRGADYGWASPATLSLFAGAAVLLALFVMLEARAAEPLVPANVARSRTVLVANSMAFFVFGSVFAFIFLGSLLMQQVLGYSPTKTGVSWLATTLTAFVVAALTGARLVNTIGVGKLLITGMALLTVCAGWLWRIPADASYATDLLPAFLLTGIAIGLCAVSVQIAALSGVASRATGLAAGTGGDDAGDRRRGGRRQRTPHRYSVPHGFRRPGRSLSPPLPSQGSRIGARLLTFHARAADQAHVASMPGTTWPVSGHPPGSSRGYPPAPVLMPALPVTTRQRLRHTSS